MPYLTLSDKISQNLALLKVDSHKIFKSQRHIINHTLLFLPQVSCIKINLFGLFLGSSKVMIFFSNLPYNFGLSHRFQSTVYGNTLIVQAYLHLE